MPTAQRTPMIVSARCLFFKVTSAMIAEINRENPAAPNKRRDPQEKGQPYSAICRMSNSSGNEDNTIDHHQRADDAAGDTGQETGEEGIAHEFELQCFDHFNGPVEKPSTKSHEDERRHTNGALISNKSAPSHIRPPHPTSDIRNPTSDISMLLVLAQHPMGQSMGDQVHRAVIGHIDHLLSDLRRVMEIERLIQTGDRLNVARQAHSGRD